MIALLPLSILALALAGGVVLLVCYRAAAAYTHPPRVVETVTPGSEGLVYEDVTLHTDDGLDLAAWYVAGTNRAALVLVHGIGTNRQPMLPLARDLNAAGYGVLLLTLRGHGLSGGQVTTFGVAEVLDIRAAVAYLSDRFDVDPASIGVYGASLGGAAAIKAAAIMPQIRAVVADSAYSSLRWMIDHELQRLLRLPPVLTPLIVTFGSWQSGARVADAAPVTAIGSIPSNRLFLIHGDADCLVPVENVRLLAEAVSPPPCVWVVPDADHVQAYSLAPEQFVARLGAFYAGRLAALAGTGHG
ncbi:MAG: alpha/beta fold hydrolase [Chloroflexi bacterium]|nr:alpha/beta fold hydrolase [Chloroflexota bacterium]